ncbi:MAG TPA: PEP/pyruvate-binding domain-containing protein, partial [bacterium]|nr:PEP/pyruvate-binding domain-containing protein [bacterium]
MSQVDSRLSTGLPGLDKMLKGLIPGDNIVWQVDCVEDFKSFLAPYYKSASERGRRVIYFRFANHAPLAEVDKDIEIIRPDFNAGFEKFVAEIHHMIGTAGRNAFFIFDCLTDLSEQWYSDRMLGNFFMLTCPYLFDSEAIAYFPIIRGKLSSDAISSIHNTAQVVIDLFRRNDMLYLHPLKVQQRYSPTMYVLHSWDGSRFEQVVDSATMSTVMTSVPWPNMQMSGDDLGVASRMFRKSQKILSAMNNGENPPADFEQHFDTLLKMVVTRDERLLEQARKYLNLSDVVQIMKRLIGTGLIGGKSAGMLIARAILRENDGKYRNLLEPHDSFYVGSDVFYTFVVRNGLWFGRQKQKVPETFLEGADETRRQMLTGGFPDTIVRQFSAMLDYYGQSPIIVRSSSLLEDNYENAFSGKYESVFCANQGSRDKRLRDFISAVLTIYASSMSENALTYRARRGLLDKDEQMPLLVQRVSGSLCSRHFYPQVAGVGYSYNPYVWDKRIDPDAGMLRLVLGLGTRAVERKDDD